MKVLIQQPYFLPWLGYLAKVINSDIFFILDKAAFRRNYLGRTALLGPNGNLTWVTIPTGASQGTPLNVIKLPQNTVYLKKIKETIRHSYTRAKHYKVESDFVFYLLNIIESSGNIFLSELNIILLEKILKYLGISLPCLLRESVFDLPTEKNLKTVKILKYLNANTLICGDGMSTQVHDLALFQKEGIFIEHFPYFTNHPKYSQCQFYKDAHKFVSGLSFIDALLNVGRVGVHNLITITPNPVNGYRHQLHT